VYNIDLFSTLEVTTDFTLLSCHLWFSELLFSEG